MNSGTRYTSSRLASVTFIRPMSGGVRLVPWSDVTTSNVSAQSGVRSQVVDELADERVGGADLHAVELVLHAGGEVVARRARVGDELGRERGPDARSRQHPRAVGQRDVDEVQRRRAVDGGDPVAEHPRLAERAALVGVEPLPLRVRLLDE